MTPLIALPAATLPVADFDHLPPLPMLSAMLCAATRLPAATDWRGGAQALCAGAVGAAGMAEIAACALTDVANGTAVCLVTPVHAVVGISRVFLAPGDQALLAPLERESLREAFNTEFGTDGMHLHAVGNSWLLQAPFAAAASDASPEDLQGAALARDPARTEQARALRRLGAEVEMWLSALPLNRDREARGMAPINCFWFWGGAHAGGLLPSQQRPVAMFSNVEADAWQTGLARYFGLPLPARVRMWSDVTQPGGALIVLQPPGQGDSLTYLPAWESDWFEPAWRDVRAGVLPALRIQIGAQAWQLPAPRIQRWLRRARPWWQQVQA
jgi:hypothetical protein